MAHKGMPFDKLNDQLSIMSYLLCSSEKNHPSSIWRLTNNKKGESINMKYLRLEIMRANFLHISSWLDSMLSTFSATLSLDLLITLGHIAMTIPISQT